MLHCTFEPQALVTALTTVDYFRSKDKSRPILNSVLMRFEPGSDSKRMEFVATDSYRLLIVSVPVIDSQVPAAHSHLLTEGVLLTLSGREVAKACPKATLQEQVDLVVSTMTGTSQFRLDRNGKWTGGGCFVRGELIEKLPTGSVEGPGEKYPDFTKLVPSDDLPASDEEIGLNPEFFGDLMAAARHFLGYGVPIRWKAHSGGAKPAVARGSAEGGAYQFKALIMPVRLS